MDGVKPTSISPDDLHGAIGTSAAPLILDVCRRAGFDGDDTGRSASPGSGRS
jgi:hypothetical protein